MWLWILQIGQNRTGYNSYSWLDNLFGAEIHNISRIVPEFQIRSAGDDVWMEPKHKYRGQARMVVARLDSGVRWSSFRQKNPDPSIETRPRRARGRSFSIQ